MPWSDQRQSLHDQYSADGFVIIRQFRSTEQVAELRTLLDDYIQDIVPKVPPMDVFYEDKDERRQIRMLPRMQEHDPRFNQLLTEGELRDVAECLNAGPVNPRDAAYFNKLPEIGQATPPHQDGYYFHLKPCKALTLWLALDDVNEDNGCVYYVRGSHQHGMRSHGTSGVLGFSQHMTDFGTDEDQQNEVAACVSAGDLIVHDALTVHRTNPNHSERTRRALGFVYFSADAVIDETARDSYQRQLTETLAAEGKI